DLKLSVTVRLTKNDLPVTPQIPALPGETIKIHVMLKNEGTSPLGCPATVTDPALPCALTLDSIIDPIPQDLLTLPNIQLRSVELPSKGSYVNVPPIEWTIPSGATLTKVAVTASGGTYGDAFADVSGLYSTYASGETELALGLPKLGVTIQATPLPPVFGQNITYMVTVTNQGLIPVTLQSGTYQIIPLTTTQAIDGIMLMSNGPRPQAQALSGPLTFTTTVLQPGQTSTATISKIEDQNGSYRFIATVNGVGLTQPVSVTSELTLTPLGSGTPTGPLDPNA